jgi:polyhydroxybutyrate depolymerase
MTKRRYRDDAVRRIFTHCMVLVICIALAACARAPRAQQNGQLGSGQHELSLRHGGRTRLAIVHVPPAARTGAPLPLVFAFHGGGGEADGFRRSIGLDALADRAGFIAVYPYGTGALPRRLLTWNAGTSCCGYAHDQQIDDVGFTIALLDHIATLIDVDMRRVYAIGHSNGAMMAYRLAAERADRIAAIVPVGGAMDLDAFSPSQRVAVLHIHSVDDPRALYGGGLGPPFPLTDRRVQHRAVLDGLARWRTHNRCAYELVVQEERRGEAGSVNAGQTATRLAYRSCAQDAPVEHWRLTGAGHGWPGAPRAAAREEIIGRPTTIIDATAVAWSFVSRFTRNDRNE